MNRFRILSLLAIILLALTALGETRNVPAASLEVPQPPGLRVVDLKSTDGTLLKATYFSAGKPGPCVLLFHQANRTRTSWDGVARQLAAAGINTVAVDGRGHGESGGTREDGIKKTPADMETFFQFLISQPGVQRDAIGLAGAGSYGVINAMETARQLSISAPMPERADPHPCASPSSYSCQVTPSTPGAAFLFSE